MQRATTKRALAGADLVGSAVLAALALLAGTGSGAAFAGGLGVLLSAFAAYRPAGDYYYLSVGSASGMLFAAYGGWALTLQGAYSYTGNLTFAVLEAASGVVAIFFILLFLYAFKLFREEK